jgi:mercuric ion transport protein
MSNPKADKHSTKTQWSVWAALAAAVGASICCVVPLALVAAGIGGAWMSNLTAFEPFRPWFIAAAVGLLAYAGYREYQTSQVPDCDCDVQMATGTRRGLLLIAAVCTVGLIAAPQMIAGITAATASPAALPQKGTQTVVLEIDRMTCASCAVSIDHALNGLDGVESAEITYEPPHATIQYDPSKLSIDDLIEAVSNTGYPARLYEGKPIKESAANSTTNSMHPIDLATLKAAFNKHSDDVRILSVVSPICEVCIKGHEVIKRVFDQYDNPDLKALTVWLPMVAGDHSEAASIQAATFEDNRLVVDGWDENRDIGVAFEKTLGLTRTAWDIYLVYEAGVRWDGEQAPHPSYWMHQLDKDSGADQQRCLNPAVLISHVGDMLNNSI